MTSRDELIEESFKAHEGAPTWQDDPVARDAAIRWHMRGFNDALAVFEEATTPTDAQVSAALLGYFPEVEGKPDLQHWGKNTRDRMRAALRAAAAAREEGKP